jgi:hypothetical protein
VEGEGAGEGRQLRCFAWHHSFIDWGWEACCTPGPLVVSEAVLVAAFSVNGTRVSYFRCGISKVFLGLYFFVRIVTTDNSFTTFHVPPFEDFRLLPVSVTRVLGKKRKTKKF